MADIRHRVGIRAPQERIYEVLTTTDGLAGWWTSTVDGDPTLGGRLRFFFGGPDPAAVMEVVEATPNSRVVWRCVEGPDEWEGTTLTFALSQAGAEIGVLFTQAGWREPVEFMHHCSTKWAVYLTGMKTWLEGGVPTAFPDDMAISSWG